MLLSHALLKHTLASFGQLAEREFRLTLLESLIRVNKLEKFEHLVRHFYVRAYRLTKLSINHKGKHSGAVNTVDVGSLTQFGFRFGQCGGIAIELVRAPVITL